MANTCPICATQWNGDLPSFEHHINACLDCSSHVPSASTSSAHIHSDSNENEDYQLALSMIATDEEIAYDHALAQALAFQSAKETAVKNSQLPSSLATAGDISRMGTELGSEDCPICGIDLGFLVMRQRNNHVIACIDGDHINGIGLQRSEGTGEEEEMVKLQHGKSWAGREPNATPGLIPIIADLLKKHAPRNAKLASPHTIYFRGTPSDVLYSCGYRNFQMLFSAARYLPHYASIGGDVPSIEQLQVITERAWGHGFDPMGAQHFGHKLVGSKRWIGTTEVYVMFTWLGFRAQVYDFPKASGPNGTHTSLATWIQNYFSCPALTSAHRTTTKDERSDVQLLGPDVLPLYLQHKGHSRTVIGIETSSKGDVNLLVFDPGRSLNSTFKKATNLEVYSTEESSMPANSTVTKVLRKLNPPNNVVTKKHLLASPNIYLEPFRVNLKALNRNTQYQILVIEHGEPLSDIEKEERKRITSIAVY